MLNLLWQPLVQEGFLAVWRLSCNSNEWICLCQWGCLPICCCTQRLRCHRKVGLCYHIRHHDVPCDTSSIRWKMCHKIHPSTAWVRRRLVIFHQFSVDLMTPRLPGYRPHGPLDITCSSLASTSLGKAWLGSQMLASSRRHTAMCTAWTWRDHSLKALRHVASRCCEKTYR